MNGVMREYTQRRHYQSLHHHDAVGLNPSPPDEEDSPLACDWKPGGPLIRVLL